MLNVVFYLLQRKVFIRSDKVFSLVDNAECRVLLIAEKSVHPQCQGVPTCCPDGMEAQPTHVP